MWIIDFGWKMGEAEGALYEAPFDCAVTRIKAERTARQPRGYAKHGGGTNAHVLKCGPH
jgi:hypothetical protein